MTVLDPSTNPLRGIGVASELPRIPHRCPLKQSKIGALPQTPPGAEPLDLDH